MGPLARYRVLRISERAFLASNTLIPLLKRLEQLGLVQRQRTVEDERVVMISLSEEGRALKEKCGCIPIQLFEKSGYPAEDALTLKG